MIQCRKQKIKGALLNTVIKEKEQQPDEETYDIDGYKDSLEKLVTMSEKEYYVHLVDINRHQVVVARSLLWVGVVILGFNVASVDWLNDKTQLLNVLVPSFIFIGFSTFLGVVSFALAALSIPAFGGYEPLYKDSWAEYACDANEELNNGNDIVYINTLNNLLGKIDKASRRGSKTNRKRGQLLRFSSIFIMASAVSLFISYVIFLFTFYL